MAMNFIQLYFHDSTVPEYKRDLYDYVSGDARKLMLYKMVLITELKVSEQSLDQIVNKIRLKNMSQWRLQYYVEQLHISRDREVVQRMTCLKKFGRFILLMIASYKMYLLQMNHRRLEAGQMNFKVYVVVASIVILLGTNWATYQISRQVKPTSLQLKQIKDYTNENVSIEKKVETITKENEILKNQISSQINQKQENVGVTNTNKNLILANVDSYTKTEDYLNKSRQNYFNLYMLYKMNVTGISFGKYEKTRIITEFLRDLLEQDPNEALKWTEGDSAKKKIEDIKKTYQGPMGVTRIVFVDLGKDLILKDLNDTQTEAAIIRDNHTIFDRADKGPELSTRYDTHKEIWTFDLKKAGDSYKIIDWDVKK